jgi:hypothetical protein
VPNDSGTLLQTERTINGHSANSSGGPLYGSGGGLYVAGSDTLSLLSFKLTAS